LQRLGTGLEVTTVADEATVNLMAVTLFGLRGARIDRRRPMFIVAEALVRQPITVAVSEWAITSTMAYRDGCPGGKGAAAESGRG